MIQAIKKEIHGKLQEKNTKMLVVILERKGDYIFTKSHPPPYLWLLFSWFQVLTVNHGPKILNGNSKK